MKRLLLQESTLFTGLRTAFAVSLVAALLAACQTPMAGSANAPGGANPGAAVPPVAVPAPPPPPSPEQIAAQEREAKKAAVRGAAQAALKESEELFDKGDFNAAIKKLSNTPEIFQADNDIQIPAYKYLAFSYCVTRRQTQCAENFNKAFSLDPRFELAASERGHPMWGPVYERVKRARPK
jgi:tetratricopeptide (TPR) repeat protein